MSITQENDDSDFGEEGRASILSLARILSESDDDDFDLENICRDESGVLTELPSLGIRSIQRTFRIHQKTIGIAVPRIRELQSKV